MIFLLLDYKITNLPLINYLVAKLGANVSLHVQKDTDETIKLSIKFLPSNLMASKSSSIIACMIINMIIL